MGINDRDYQREEPRRTPGFFSQVTPVVKAILIANLAIYFLDMFLADPQMENPWARQHFAFAIQSAIFEHRYWEFITFQFLHGSVGHVLFNSLVFFFFGPFMERWWGSARFLLFYLLCGIAGALFYILLAFTGVLHADPREYLIGASAGIYGVLIGVAVVAPDLRVTLLFPPIELSMRQLAIAMLAIAVGSVALQVGGNEGGEAGHLGGAILGFLLVRFPGILGKTGSDPAISPSKPRPRPSRSRQLPKLRPRSELEKQQDSAVDLILDKISREGFQSLTQEERDFLQKASESKK